MKKEIFIRGLLIFIGLFKIEMTSLTYIIQENILEIV